MRRDWWAGIAWAVILLIYRMPSPQHHWRPLAGGRAGGVAAHPPGQNPPHPSGGTPPPRGNCNWQPVSVCSGGGHASRNKGGEEGNLNHHSPPPDSDRGGLLLKMFSWPHGPQQATAKRGYVTSVQTKKANQGLTRPEETQARRENSKDAAARAPPRTATLRIARCLYSCVGYVLALFC